MPVESNNTAQSEATIGKGVYRPKIFIVFYSTYLHIYKLALAIKKGVEKEGLCDVTLYQIAETLSLEVQAKIRAPPKPDIPIITPQLLREADGILFGFPTRYGTLPSQLKEFFDACGQLWATGGLSGKFSGAFVSTATQHGGQETSIFTLLTTLAHFGMMFVPLGYVTPHLNEDKVIMGGGPWGASMSAGKDGTRQPSEEELEIARIQGANFSSLIAQFHRNSEDVPTIPKALFAENEKVENDQTNATQASPLAAVAVVPSFEKAGELPGLKDNVTPLADIGSPVFPIETISESSVSKDPHSEGLIEKPSEVVAPLSASKALADFNIEEKDDNIPPVNLSEKSPTLSQNPEIPHIDVAPELKPKKTASNDKDTGSLIEMSVIDNIFNEARNTFPKEMSKTNTSSSKDNIINDTSETKVVETPSKESKSKTAIVVAGVAAAVGVSALVAKQNQDNPTSSNIDVAPEDIKPVVQPGIAGEEKLNEVKESYFPPQENSSSVDTGIPGATDPDTVKSPDVESRGISASKAFNKDDPESFVKEADPVPVVEIEHSGQIQEPVVAAPRKKSSLMELPLPATATEASGFKKKNLKGSTDNVLPPTEGEEIIATTSQEGSHKKTGSFARNSATNLRRFFKSLSIRGKPSDMG